MAEEKHTIDDFVDNRPYASKLIWPAVIPGAIIGQSKKNRSLLESQNVRLFDGRFYEAVRVAVPALIGLVAGKYAGEAIGMFSFMSSYVAMTAYGQHSLLNEQRNLENPLNRALLNNNTLQRTH